MGSTDEHKAIARAVLAELTEGDDTHMSHFTEEQRKWVETGSEHVEIKDFPLLGTFMSILRKALLWFFLLIISALLLHGVFSASGAMLKKVGDTVHSATEIK